MKFIFFDLETKRLLRDVENTCWVFNSWGSSPGFASSITSKFDKWPTYEELVEDLGEPDIAPWIWICGI